MRIVKAEQISNAVCDMTAACFKLTDEAYCALERAHSVESCPAAKEALDMLLQNAHLAASKRLPVCQDTGMAVFFVKLGQDVYIEGGLLDDAINEGVRRGYAQNGLRASVVDPITRKNTGDNTPAIVHVEIVSGDKIEIAFLPKGFGSENMSRLYMLTPSVGIDGVKRAVVEAVKLAGANPCPPIVVGVGIGGTSDEAMLLAKKQLLRPVGQPAEDETLRRLEAELLDDINALRIGAQGFSGDTTALAVHVGKCPTHIAALPVGINIQCNAVRIERAVL